MIGKTVGYFSASIQVIVVCDKRANLDMRLTKPVLTAISDRGLPSVQMLSMFHLFFNEGCFLLFLLNLH